MSTLSIVIIVGGLAAVAAGLLYVFHRDAKADMLMQRLVNEEPKHRVRKAWSALAQELGRPPTNPELIDRLYPPDEIPPANQPGATMELPHNSSAFGQEKGASPPLPPKPGDPEHDGLPPSYALKEMGLSIHSAITELDIWLDEQEDSA